MEKKDKGAYALYEKALCENDYSSLAAWIEHIRSRFEKKGKRN